MSYSRYFKMATAMLTGTAKMARTAAMLATTVHAPCWGPSALAATTPARQAESPPSSHFSCCRRSPEARRKLASWPASTSSPLSPIVIKTASWSTFHQPGELGPLSRVSRLPPESTRTAWRTMALAVRT